MKIINVIEYADDTILSVKSFPILPTDIEQDVVNQAEKLFADKAKENGLKDDDLQFCLDEGRFSEGRGGYQVYLTWSE